ncbi:hypothetical protein [Flavobacterium sp.]|jgi:hypothetical protein|uniref:hypothetical protein n=1 Tax=Flavobacterium sp. TaxID=239 RepID=UPI0035B07061
MKKIILSLALITLLISCKEETREKVKEASKAVGTEVKENYKKAKIKASKVIDTTKVKENVKNVIKKGAEKIEEGAKKVKENASK